MAILFSQRTQFKAIMEFYVHTSNLRIHAVTKRATIRQFTTTPSETSFSLDTICRTVKKVVILNDKNSFRRLLPNTKWKTLIWWYNDWGFRIYWRKEAFVQCCCRTSWKWSQHLLSSFWGSACSWNFATLIFSLIKKRKRNKFSS